MDARQLFFEDGTPSSVWFCGKCRTTWSHEAAAESCCKPVICECGAPAERHRTACRPCIDKHERQRDEARWAKAVPSKPTEWVYVENVDEFTQDPEETAEWHNMDIGDLRVYCCTEVRPMTDASWLVEHALEDAHQDAHDEIKPRDIDELQGILDAWWAETGLHWWEPDYRRKVTAND